MVDRNVIGLACQLSLMHLSRLSSLLIFQTFIESSVSLNFKEKNEIKNLVTS